MRDTTGSHNNDTTASFLDTTTITSMRTETHAQDASSSFPTLLNLRTTGQCRAIKFQNRITRQRAAKRCLLQSPCLQSLDRSLTSLHLDDVERRFLLAGSDTGIVSVYDLSLQGSNSSLQQGKNTNASNKRPAKADAITHHAPVARSVRVPAVLTEDVPVGHSSTVRVVAWYPADTGAFISAAADGSVLVWDTANMTAVARYLPLQHDNGFLAVGMAGPALHSMAVSRYSALAAIVSPYVAATKLTDLRSGAASHSLVGHSSGVQAVQWSPTCSYILATGGLDGTVRLWDIRKTGSRCCLAVCNKDAAVATDKDVSVPYRADCAHWRTATNKKQPTLGVSSSSSNAATKSKSRKQRVKQQQQHAVAPNNYQAVQGSKAVSHTGPVTGLAFTETGHSLLSTGADGELRLWDLRTASGPQWVPRRFTLTGDRLPVDGASSRTPLAVTHDGSDGDTVWVGNGSRLAGYSVQEGGTARYQLTGHLSRLNAIQAVPDSMQIFTCASDGLILTWGPKSSSSVARTKGRKKRQHREIFQEDRDSW
jgi:DNA excision repair protein ERCC-8